MSRDVHEPQPPALPAHAQTNDGERTPDEEIVYYEGSPLLRGEIGLVLLWFLAGAAVIALPILWASLASDGPPWWLWFAVVVGLLLIFVPSLWVKRHRYTITNHRIDVESGLLGKSIDTLELWHVNDIGMRQGFLDRIFRVGTIVVDADDRSTPHLELRSLARPRNLYENLKQRVIHIKLQRGVIKIDDGH